jgi:Zn-dependent metalloprotease
VGLRAMGGIPTKGANAADRALDLIGSEPMRRLFGSLAPRDHLVVLGIGSTPRGDTLVRFRQVNMGVPVEGGHLGVVLDAAGRGLEVSGRFVYRPRTKRAPTVSSQAALTDALAVALRKACGDELQCRQRAAAQPPRVTLVVLSSEIFNGTLLPPKTARLAWKIEHAGRRLFWDAENRSTAPLLSFSTVWDFLYNIRNRTGGNTLEIMNGVVQAGVTPHADATLMDALLSPSTSNRIEAFYLSKGWNSFDNTGTTLNILINAGTGNRASWVPAGGDFTGADALSMKFSRSWVVPDVVAHEFTHGVTEFSAAFSNTGETGGLGESYSDVLASVIFPDCSDGTQSPTCATTTTTWLAGEGSPLGFLRDLQKPETNCTNAVDPGCMAPPRHYGQVPNNCGGDNPACEMHRISVIPSLAAVLMADGVTGSTHSGLGRAKLGELVFRTLTGGRLFAADQFLHHTLATLSTCYDLAVKGQAGFTPADCNHVERSLLQVGLTTNVTYGSYRFSGINFSDNQPYFTGQRLYRGCTVASSTLTATDADGTQMSATGSKLEDVAVDMNGWGAYLIERAAITQPTNRSVVLHVWSRWQEAGQVDVEDTFNVPSGVTREQCLLPAPPTPAVTYHPRILYSTLLLSKWAEWLEGHSDNQTVNGVVVRPQGFPLLGSVQMPPGCTVTSVQGLEYHGSQSLPPAVPQIDHGQHGFVVTSGAQTPRDLLAFIHWWHTGISSIKVRGSARITRVWVWTTTVARFVSECASLDGEGMTRHDDP